MLNLYNHAEREALQDEIIRLTDQWPHCDQERAIELQRAFNDFTGWDDPEIAKWESPRHELLYEIKRGDPERKAHYTQAHQAIQDEIKRRDAAAGA